MGPDDHAAAARREADALLAALDGALDVEVPACPGWTLADLLAHVGAVCGFWGSLVADPDPDLGPQDVSHPAITSLDELSARLDDLLALLRASKPAQPCWTWAEPHTVAFVQRRIAHELAIHRWDAQGARGQAEPIATDLAVDGIDEFLSINLGRRPRADAEPVGGSVHLHATDTGGEGEWVIEPLPGGSDRPFLIGTGHTKCDAALRGTASGILLTLWRRTSDGVEVLGDPRIAQQFLAFSAL